MTPETRPNLSEPTARLRSTAAWLLGAMAAGLLAACSLPTDEATMTTTLTGTATYRERMLLRPESILNVHVLDTSRADAPADTIASISIDNPGNPPYRFDIPIDADAIDANRRYVVRADIRTAGELIMSTDSVYPVLTRGAGTKVDLILRMVARDATNESVSGLPASFAGVLPCADCPGIEYHVDLLPDAAYYFRQTYLERGRNVDSIGAWSIDTASATLTLWSAMPAVTQFRIVDGGTLRLLDRNGDDIESALNYNLVRAATFDPATLELPLRGMYSYLADAGTFTECESGRRFAVAQEADNAALESAYLAAGRQENESLLVSFDGRITMRPPVEGTGMQPTVIVDSFTGVWPAETCGARMSVSELRGTNWVATRIAADPVVLTDGMREARLMFAADGNGVSGFSGCNNFSGTAEISGGSIRFGPTATNLRACIGPAAELEARLFAALDNAARYELQRHHLDIHDDQGALAVRFEARELE